MPGYYEDETNTWAERTWALPPDFDEDDDELGEPPPLTPDEEAEEADRALLGLNFSALRELVWEGLRRRHRSTDDVMYYNRETLLRIARELAAEQVAKRETKLQRIANPWRMCHTELVLRLAVHLLREDLVTTDVTVALSGREVTRYGRPMFDIARFFDGCAGGKLPGGSLRGSRTESPIGRWRLPGSPHGVVLTLDRSAPSIVAELGPGSRIIVHAYPGPTRATSGGIEGHVLAQAIGAALTRFDLADLDIPVVALPRSPRMRTLVDRARDSRRIAAAGLSIALVSTVGEVDGLPFPTKPAPTVYDADD